MAYAGPERRHHERSKLERRTRLWLREDEGGRLVEFEGFGTALNLALGGVFVHTTYLLPVGYPLNVEVEIEEGPTIVARAYVVHTVGEDDPSGSPSGMGLALIEVDSQNRETLLRYIVPTSVGEFFSERFIREFPHLENVLSLSDIALIVNLWQDKESRIDGMRHPGGTEAKEARVQEAARRGGRR